MKKKILFPVLLIATLAIGGVVAYAIWTATTQTFDGYMADGKKAYDAKDFNTARIQLLNAVQADGTSRTARYMLAQTFLNLGDGNSAARQLITLLETHPDDVEANVLMGNLYLAAGAQDPKNLREATEIAKKILDKDADSVPGLTLSANVAAAQKDFETAIQTFTKVTTLDPQNSSAYVSLGTIQVLQKNNADAEKAFLKAREVDPKNRSAIVSLSNFYRTTKEDAKAEAVLNDGLAQVPNDPGLTTMLVQLYYQTGRFETGVNLLKDRLAKNPKDAQIYAMLSDLYKAKNMNTEARDTLVEAKQALPESPEIALKLATNLLGDDPQRARREIQEVLDKYPDHPAANLMLGELLFNAGEFDEAEKRFSRDVLTQSRFPEAPFFLGTMALRKGDVDKAQELFQRSISYNPNYLLARASLAEVLFAKGNPTAARSEVDKVLSLQRSYVPARLLKVSIDRLEQNFPAVEAELTALVKEQPNNPLVHQQWALYYGARGQFPQAEKSFSRVLELQPTNQDALRGLTEIYVRTKQSDKAVRLIEGMPDDQKGALHYELLGIAYSSLAKNAEAETAFKKAIEKEPSRTGADALLARHYIANGRMKEGLAQLDELARKVPTAAAAYGAKGLIYESEGDLENAKNSYDQALKVDPNYEPAANNLAYILAEEGKDLQKALEYAQTARRRQPESAAIADTLGWVHHKMGNQVLARDQLTFAVSKDPENPTLQYHLGMIYKANQQELEAQSALKKALASKQAFKERPLAESALKEVQNR